MSEDAPVRLEWPHLANVVGFVSTLAVLGCLLLLGTGTSGISETEKRALAPAPDCSPARILDGTCMAKTEAFVPDHFPFREAFLQTNFWLRAHLGFLSETFAFYDVALNEGVGSAPVEELEQDLPAPEELAVGASGESPLGAPPPQEATKAAAAGAARKVEAAPSPAASPQKETGGGLSSSHGILIFRGRAMEGFGGGPRGSKPWADSVNAYQDSLHGTAKVYALLAPSASAFYLPEKYHRYSMPQKPNIDATYASLKPGIVAVDAYSEMEKHVSEHLHFRTDHHWTGRGAYYAYRAFCNAAGLQPVELAQMQLRTQAKWYGSLYAQTRDRRLIADPVEHFIPPVATTSMLYEANGLGNPRPTRLFYEGPSGYGVFLGGDSPMFVARTPLNNGRRILLVKNSYGNAFAPLLVSHFEEVIVVDYRYFTGNLLQIIRLHGITDVLVLSNVHAANTPYHIWRIKKILQAKPAATVAKPAVKPVAPSPAAVPTPGTATAVAPAPAAATTVGGIATPAAGTATAPASTTTPAAAGAAPASSAAAAADQAAEFAR